MPKLPTLKYLLCHCSLLLLVDSDNTILAESLPGMFFTFQPFRHYSRRIHQNRTHMILFFCGYAWPPISFYQKLSKQTTSTTPLSCHYPESSHSPCREAILPLSLYLHNIFHFHPDLYFSIHQLTKRFPFRTEHNIIFSANGILCSRCLSHVFQVSCAATVIICSSVFYRVSMNSIALHKLLSISSGEIFAVWKVFDMPRENVHFGGYISVRKSTACDSGLSSLYFVTGCKLSFI